MFEKATREKFRFDTPKGSVSIEDLWDLPLTGKGANLDSIAKGLHKKMSEADVYSFVIKVKKPDERVANQFKIVKHIIDVRLQEKDLAEKAAAVREKKQKILAIIADKEDQSLKDVDLDGLRKLLEEV